MVEADKRKKNTLPVVRMPQSLSDWQNPKLEEHTQLPHETQFVNGVPFFDDFPIDDSEDGDALDFESPTQLLDRICFRPCKRPKPVW
jgi:hypothetical protein